MSLQFFGPKTIGSLLIGSGALGGGGIIYWHQMPRTGRELLTKEGLLFLNNEDEYKGMFNDQKDSDDGKGDETVKAATSADVKTKAETYCAKLNENLSSSSGSDYETTKRKLIAFCTSGGIKTVKARLIQNKKDKGIDDNTGDKGKPIFAIYRYDPKFISGLKEEPGNSSLSESSLSESSSVDDGGEKLKTACSTLLAKPYRELSENKYFEYAFWWCTELGYTNVEDRIKKLDTTGAQENTGSNIKNKWENTKKVTTQIKTDLSKETSHTLTDDEYKQGCDTQLKKELKKELKENSYYRDKYVMIKSVCRSTTQAAK